MFDIDGLAKQVLNEDFMSEFSSDREEVFEIRQRPDENLLFFKNSSEDKEYSKILKSLYINPTKTYRIGEVVELLAIKDSVLRYWESKFSKFIKPIKNKGGQRLYKLKDIECLLKIKKLLMVDRLSIEGVKSKLLSNEVIIAEKNDVSKEVLFIIKEELEQAVGILNKSIDDLSRIECGK